MADTSDLVGDRKARKGNNGGGWPSHTPTDDLRAKVRTWAAVGTTQEVIASELHITVDTLVKYYREELDEASARGVANVASNLYAKAMSGDVTSMIFYLKTRGRWSEKASVGDSDNPLVVQTDPLDRALELAKQAARAKTPGV
jgi:hypothetical protein